MAGPPPTDPCNKVASGTPWLTWVREMWVLGGVLGRSGAFLSMAMSPHKILPYCRGRTIAAHFAEWASPSGSQCRLIAP
jgi:hypothetical protein